MGVSSELRTPRLRLRQFEESDLDAWARITADAETMHFLGNGRSQTRDDARASLGYMQAHWVWRGFGLWAAEERATGELVGRIGLYRPAGWPGLEVGWLIERGRWGEGLATEGAREVVDHAFGADLDDCLISAIQPENAASIRVAEKLGSRFRESRQLAGHRVSIHALDHQTWLRFRSAHRQQEVP